MNGNILYFIKMKFDEGRYMLPLYKRMAIVPLAIAFIEAKFNKGSNLCYGSIFIVPH